jgi:hypothetical protein
MEVLYMPGGQVVDDADLVRADESVHEIGADEARSAGDENAHGQTS